MSGGLQHLLRDNEHAAHLTELAVIDPNAIVAIHGESITSPDACRVYVLFKINLISPHG